MQIGVNNMTNFTDMPTELHSPGRNHFIVTPSDTLDLPHPSRGLYVNVGGTVVLRDRAGVDVSYIVAAGASLPFCAVRVMSTGTDAVLVGWY